jgi:hypothetical protein
MKTERATPQTPTAHTATAIGKHPAEPAAGRPDQGWPMVGRAQELADLQEVLMRASGGRVSTALLIGEPGVGKTRLLQELAALAESAGFTVVTGGCSQD